MKILILYFLLSATAAFAESLTLINGTPANPKDFPASVYASMGNSRCTATVIGKRVLLIAAHCVGNGGTANFAIGPNRYSSKCTHSPNYRGNSTADWALCQVTADVMGAEYESVNQDESRLQVNDEILLTGYGCIRPGGGGGNDGVYRIGKARVVRLPVGNDNDLRTTGGAALCFGDSGGPAFAEKDGERWVMTVNSRGDIRINSYLSALATNQFKSFVSSWMSSTKQEICGISENATGCRNKPVKPGRTFEIDTVVAVVKGTVKEEYVNFYDNIVTVTTEFLEVFRE